MKAFTFSQWIIILILSLLTALEPLSIDLYLPGFINIARAFGTSVSMVQISLSTFLGGFALGQLIWGPLADKFGRKKPILISLAIFMIASVLCVHVKSIEQLWVLRFIQALGGCGGVVISRAVVTDYFDKAYTLKIFSLLALIMGIAPILAPSIGNGILKFLNWQGVFYTLAVLGILLFSCTLFLLPETHPKYKRTQTSGVFRNYLSIIKNRQFLKYSLIAGFVNGALMVYVANGPFLIMEKGGFSGNMFSLIFSVNALGLMLGSFLASFLQRFMSTIRLTYLSLLFMFSVNIILIVIMYLSVQISAILVVLFFYVFPLGILLPTTTELAMKPFTDHNSGTASALFGSIQLAIAFICSVISNYMTDGTIIAIGFGFLLCSLFSFVIVFSGIYQKIPFIKVLVKR